MVQNNAIVKGASITSGKRHITSGYMFTYFKNYIVKICVIKSQNFIKLDFKKNFEYLLTFSWHIFNDNLNEDHISRLGKNGSNIKPVGYSL